MRLTPEQVATIKQTAHTMLGADGRVTFFGSRVDDTKRGGNIDFLFETEQLLDNRVATAGIIYVALVRKLGDWKMDILVQDAATPPAPVLAMAKQTGIAL